MRACVCMCVRVDVRARARACVCMHVCVREWLPGIASPVSCVLLGGERGARVFVYLRVLCWCKGAFAVVCSCRPGALFCLLGWCWSRFRYFFPLWGD